MNDSGIESCPFCNSDKVSLNRIDETSEGIPVCILYVKCENCLARGPIGPNAYDAIWDWNRLTNREKPTQPKVKTVPLSSLKDTDYVWIMAGNGGIYRTVEKAKREFTPWKVTFLCEIDTPVINFDTFDQRIFDLVDDSEYQFYIGDGEGDYPYYSPEIVKQMYDILMAGIREKGKFVKPTDVQVVKD